MDTHQYLWDHFKFNADQRLKAFNFFSVFSLAADGGLITIWDKAKNPLIPHLIVGLFIIALCICFFIIDRRSKELIDIAVPGLKETELHLPESARLFWIDSRRKSKYGYSKAFKTIFVLQGIIGLAVAVHALVESLSY